jgi:hypothetical protein
MSIPQCGKHCQGWVRNVYRSTGLPLFTHARYPARKVMTLVYPAFRAATAALKLGAQPYPLQ